MLALMNLYVFAEVLASVGMEEGCFAHVSHSSVALQSKLRLNQGHVMTSNSSNLRIISRRLDTIESITMKLSDALHDPVVAGIDYLTIDDRDLSAHSDCEADVEATREELAQLQEKIKDVILRVNVMSTEVKMLRLEDADKRTKIGKLKNERDRASAACKTQHDADQEMLERLLQDLSRLQTVVPMQLMQTAEESWGHVSRDHIHYHHANVQRLADLTKDAVANMTRCVQQSREHKVAALSQTGAIRVVSEDVASDKQQAVAERTHWVDGRRDCHRIFLESDYPKTQGFYSLVGYKNNHSMYRGPNGAVLLYSTSVAGDMCATHSPPGDGWCVRQGFHDWYGLRKDIPIQSMEGMSGWQTREGPTDLVDVRCAVMPEEDSAFFMLRHSSGACLHPKGSDDLPAMDGPLVLRFGCDANAVRVLLKRISVVENGKATGYFMLQHFNGMCVHPENGLNPPHNGTQLVWSKEMNVGCDAGNTDLYFTQIPVRGGFLLQHWSGACVHPRGGNAIPRDGTELVLHASCDLARSAFKFEDLYALWPPPASRQATPVSASMSSEFNSNCSATNCIDGDVSSSEECISGTSLCHTLEETEGPWLQIDLGSKHLITEVVLYNRLDCCQDLLGLHEIWLSLASESWRRCFSGIASEAAGPFRESCTGWGRYVRIVLPGAFRTMNLLEVRVFALTFNSASAGVTQQLTAEQCAYEHRELQEVSQMATSELAVLIGEYHVLANSSSCNDDAEGKFQLQSGALSRSLQQVNIRLREMLEELHALKPILDGAQVAAVGLRARLAAIVRVCTSFRDATKDLEVIDQIMGALASCPDLDPDLE